MFTDGYQRRLNDQIDRLIAAKRWEELNECVTDNAFAIGKVLANRISPQLLRDLRDCPRGLMAIFGYVLIENCRPDMVKMLLPHVDLTASLVFGSNDCPLVRVLFTYTTLLPVQRILPSNPKMIESQRLMRQNCQLLLRADPFAGGLVYRDGNKWHCTKSDEGKHARNQIVWAIIGRFQAIQQLITLIGREVFPPQLYANAIWRTIGTYMVFRLKEVELVRKNFDL